MLKNKLKYTAILPFLFIAFLLTPSFAQTQTVYNSNGRRDPFMALVTSDGRVIKLEDKNVQDNSLILEGIIYDDYGLSYAMINTQVVKTGDWINGYQVLRIKKDSVLFIKDGEIQEIKLKKGEDNAQ